MLFSLAVLVGTGALSRCVFLHGIGETITAPTTPTDTGGYWGGSVINQYLGVDCNSTAFIHQDTSTRTWDDPELLTAFCQAVAGGTDLSTPVPNTVVISHSMGNLAIGEAFRTGLCSLDDSSSTWLSLHAPWMGSKAADFVTKLCQDPSIWSAPVRWLATDMAYCCNSSTARGCNSTLEPNVGYLALRPSYPQLADAKLFKFASGAVHASMCGRSAVRACSQRDDSHRQPLTRWPFRAHGRSG